MIIVGYGIFDKDTLQVHEGNSTYKKKFAFYKTKGHAKSALKNKKYIYDEYKGIDRRGDYVIKPLFIT